MLSVSGAQDEAQSISPATQRLTAGACISTVVRDTRVVVAAGDTNLAGWRGDGVAGSKYAI
jgi:hypothetical protein